MILILDTETTGVDDGAVCIEVACALYSLKHAAVVRSFSSLIRHHENPAEAVNRISPALLAEAPLPGNVWPVIDRMALSVRAIVAHSADFDRRFVPPIVAANAPWVCSMDDLAWPRPAGRSLVALALAHDLGVSHAHRAAVDVDLLARLFTRAAEMGADLEAMITRGLRPKALFVALVPFERKDEAKVAGFKWDESVPKAWSRRMAIEDVAALPFKVREVAA